MHTLECRLPGRELLEFVRVYAQREIRGLEVAVAEPVPARLEQTMEFQFGSPFGLIAAAGDFDVSPPDVVMGAITDGKASIVLGDNVISFAVFFQPTGLARLFGIPMIELTGRANKGVDVLGSFVSRLADQLACCPTFAQRARTVEAALLSNAARARARKRDFVEESARRIFLASGAVRVTCIASDYGLSLRQFERRFEKGIGMGPKTFARVARFQAALDAKLRSPSTRWLDIAHGLCYHDQMHMVRDFHDLAGAAPGKIFDEIGDGRPPAMGEHHEISLPVCKRGC